MRVNARSKHRLGPQALLCRKTGITGPIPALSQAAWKPGRGLCARNAYHLDFRALVERRAAGSPCESLAIFAVNTAHGARARTPTNSVERPQTRDNSSIGKLTWWATRVERSGDDITRLAPALPSLPDGTEATSAILSAVHGDSRVLRYSRPFRRRGSSRERPPWLRPSWQ